MIWAQYTSKNEKLAENTKLENTAQTNEKEDCLMI